MATLQFYSLIEILKSCPFDNSSNNNTDQMITDYYFNKKRFFLSTENILNAFESALITKEINLVKCWVNERVYVAIGSH